MTSWLVRLVVMAAAGFLAACGAPAAPPPAPGSADVPIAVVASLNVWGDVATSVGGDQVRVTSIVANAAGDPHSYQVTAKDAARLAAAALVVSNGGGYDDYVDEALGPDSAVRRVVAVDLHPDADNEHVWYDLPTVAAVADRIAAELAGIRPAARDTFTANAERFKSGLEGVRQQLDRIAQVHAGTPVVATEPVAQYLLEAAKLADQTPPEFVEAIEEQAPPPARVIAQVQGLVARRAVALVMHNPQTETPVTTDLLAAARAANVPVVDVMETLPSGQHYAEWLGGEVQAVAAALDASMEER